MKVKDLIAELGKLDPETEVWSDFCDETDTTDLVLDEHCAIHFDEATGVEVYTPDGVYIRAAYHGA